MSLHVLILIDVNCILRWRPSCKVNRDPGTSFHLKESLVVDQQSSIARMSGRELTVPDSVSFPDYYQ